MPIREFLRPADVSLAASCRGGKTNSREAFDHAAKDGMDVQVPHMRLQRDSVTAGVLHSSRRPPRRRRVPPGAPAAGPQTRCGSPGSRRARATTAPPVDLAYNAARHRQHAVYVLRVRRRGRPPSASDLVEKAAAGLQVPAEVRRREGRRVTGVAGEAGRDGECVHFHQQRLPASQPAPSRAAALRYRRGGVTW